MFRVNKTVLVRILLPARVVALVGDVALASPRLKLPQVQPRLVVLTKTDMKVPSVNVAHRGEAALT